MPSQHSGLLFSLSFSLSLSLSPFRSHSSMKIVSSYAVMLYDYISGTYQKRKFETNISVDKYAWGYRRNAKLSDYMTMEEILTTLAMTIR